MQRRSITNVEVYYKVDDADLKYKVEESAYPHFIVIRSLITNRRRQTTCEIVEIDRND